MGALDGKIAIVTGRHKRHRRRHRQGLCLGRGEGRDRRAPRGGRPRAREAARRSFRPRGRGQRGRRQGDGRSNARMVRSPRLPRQQRRNSVADDQHHRDRHGDHRSGSRCQRPWRDPGRPSTPRSPCSRRALAASSISAASRDTAAASRLTSIPPRKGPSAHLPAPPRRSWAKRESASTRISPGAIVTGIFGKNAGLEGSKADQVAGVVKETLRRRSSRSRARACRTISRRRRCFLPATPPDSSTGRTSSSTAARRRSPGGGRLRWPGARKWRSASRPRLRRFRVAPRVHRALV